MLTFGLATTTWCETVAAFVPLQYGVWPVNTRLLEQPSLSVTVRVTWW